MFCYNSCNLYWLSAPNVFYWCQNYSYVWKNMEEML